METGALMDAVEQALRARFPGENVYRDRLPKDFQRPSFALELEKTETAAVNIGLVRKTAAVLVTCFTEVDAYGDSSREELDRRGEAVLDLLAGRVWQVGDRCPAVRVGKGLGGPDLVEARAEFSWVDVRPGYRDPDAPEAEGGAPVLEDFALHVDVSAAAERKE